MGTDHINQGGTREAAKDGGLKNPAVDGPAREEGPERSLRVERT